MKIIRIPVAPAAFSPKIEELTQEVASRISWEVSSSHRCYGKPEEIKGVLEFDGGKIHTRSSVYRKFDERGDNRRSQYPTAEGMHSEKLADGTLGFVQRLRSEEERRQLTPEPDYRALAVELLLRLRVSQEQLKLLHKYTGNSVVAEVDFTLRSNALAISNATTALEGTSK